MNSNANKKRELTIVEYFEALQIEYLVCEIRRKFYPSPTDKSYLKRVMEFKKKKIEDIASRNMLDSIFTDEELMKELRLKVYPTIGLPKFDLDEKDLTYYYMAGSDIRVVIENKTKIGKLVSVDSEANIAKVSLKGEQGERFISCAEVTRIL